MFPHNGIRYQLIRIVSLVIILSRIDFSFTINVDNSNIWLKRLFTRQWL